MSGLNKKPPVNPCFPVDNSPVRGMMGSSFKTINSMKKQLTHVAPLKAGLVLGILQGLLSLIFVPFFLLFAVLGGAAAAKSGSPFPAIFGAGFAVILPLFYAIIGFIVGALGALIYNLIAKWTGGLEFEVKDLPPAV